MKITHDRYRIRKLISPMIYRVESREILPPPRFRYIVTQCRQNYEPDVELSLTRYTINFFPFSSPFLLPCSRPRTIIDCFPRVDTFPMRKNHQRHRRRERAICVRGEGRSNLKIIIPLATRAIGKFQLAVRNRYHYSVLTHLRRDRIPVGNRPFNHAPPLRIGCVSLVAPPYRPMHSRG